MKKWTPKEIRSLRDSLGLTQQAFGDLVGVTWVYISNLEGGLRTPGRTLCILLDCIQKKDKGGSKHGMHLQAKKR